MKTSKILILRSEKNKKENYCQKQRCSHNIRVFPANFTSQAEKYIRKFDGGIKERIQLKINKLEEDPFPQEVERVEDYKGEKLFRVRVGDERILYIVRYNPNTLIIVKIDKRSRVYK